MNKKKVLIVGSSAKEYALAKYLAKSEKIDKVYIAPGNVASGEFAERIDIRENSVDELLEFAVKESVDLTIASSSEAIKSDITEVFQANAQLIFAPSCKSANFALSRSIAKKFLYKLHIPTPKFGIFDKSQFALDYAKNANMPIIVSSDVDSETSIQSVCTDIKQARTCINDLFMRNESKVIMSDYVYGHPFTVYVITDGWKALVAAVVGDYKFLEDGDAGIYTRGIGTYLPDYKVSFDVIGKIMANVVTPVLENLQKKETPYSGILGVECVLKNDGNYVVTGFTPFFKEHDCSAILTSIDADVYSLFEACAIGSFADDYDDIALNDLSVISCVLVARKAGAIINGLELVDDATDVSHFSTTKNNYLEYLTNKGRTLVLTQSASTFRRARELLYDNVDEVYFEGKKFRRDICAE